MAKYPRQGTVSKNELDEKMVRGIMTAIKSDRVELLPSVVRFMEYEDVVLIRIELDRAAVPA